MAQFKLMGLGDELEGKEFSFQSRITIGRAMDNDIVIRKPGVSRNHVEVVFRDGKLMIRDLGSSNGTKVNGEDIIHAELKSGDRVEVEGIQLVLVSPQEASPPQAPADEPSPDQTVFYDMNQVAQEAKEDEDSPQPIDTDKTGFVDMSGLVRQDEEEKEERHNEPSPQSTEFLDMQKVLGEKDDESQKDDEPRQDQTSFIDMKDMFGKEGEEKAAPDETSFVDMEDVFGKKEPSEKPEKSAKEPQPHAGDQTSFVDMKDVFGDTGPIESDGKKPEADQTSYIDMKDLMDRPATKSPEGASPLTASERPDAKNSPFMLVAIKDRQEHQFRVPCGTTLVGSSDECDLKVSFAGVSPKHAKLIYDGQKLQVEGLGAAAGVFVNLNKVLNPTDIKAGDEILIGRCSLYCRRADSEDSKRIELKGKKKRGFFGWLFSLFGGGR
ncbi:MAG: FHA domain-containing protein [Planctomycetota bacterium]|nr:FHA domain-containing protein [Planctomycetota bacterium]